MAAHAGPGATEADQPPQHLHPAGVVEGPSLMRLQLYTRRTVSATTAGLATITRTTVDHAAYTIPLGRRDTGPDVGEPARLGYEVDEQSAAEAAVLARQELGERRPPRPPAQTSHPRTWRVPALGVPIPADPRAFAAFFSP